VFCALNAKIKEEIFLENCPIKIAILLISNRKVISKIKLIKASTRWIGRGYPGNASY
jgi:hypothetical protein